VTRQESERGRVVIGMDAHKRSVTIELMDPEETVHGGGRPGTDVVGPQGHVGLGEAVARPGCGPSSVVRGSGDTWRTACWPTMNRSSTSHRGCRRASAAP